jgi:hypothetical protein
MNFSIRSFGLRNSGLAFAAATALTLSACMSGNTGTGGETETQTTARKPGQIRLVSMSGLSKGALDSATTAFTLDTARSSFQQYFILQNTGDEPITNLTFTTDNPNFTFSPSHIAVLPPSAGASVLQVIKLNVVHGKLLDQVGQGTFLSPGAVTVHAAINGSTDTGAGEIAVSENLTLSTFAKLARFEIGIADSALRTLDKVRYGNFMSPVLGYPFHMYYLQVDSTGGNYSPDIVLKNTGNVALTIEKRARLSPFAILDSLVLPPDSTILFKSNIFRIDAHGTTFAPWGTPVEDDGKVLFSVDFELEDFTPEPETPDPIVPPVTPPVVPPVTPTPPLPDSLQ